jgi:hypothetical protein
MNNLDTLASVWLELKDDERKVTDMRRDIEDQILSLVGLPDTFEGTETAGDEMVIKMTTRMNKKIDSDKLQELAAENGIESSLSSLFRWKPEINAAAWKSCSSDITDVLLGAITTTPGRPSFSITPKGTK